MAQIKKTLTRAGEVRYIVDFRHAGRRYRKFFDRFEEADAYLSKEKLKIYGDQFYAKPKPVSLAQFAREYLQDSRVRKSPSTHRHVDQFRIGRFLSYLYARRTGRSLGIPIARTMDCVERNDSDALKGSPALADFERFLRATRLDRISPVEVAEYQSRLKEEGHPPHTINDYLQTLKGAMNFAIQRKYLAATPAAGIRKIPVGRTVFKPLSKDQIVALLRAAQVDDGRRGRRFRRSGRRFFFFELLATALFGGLRKQELIHLNWEDLDFASDQILIKAKPGFQPKWHHERAVPLEPLLRQILEPISKGEGPCFPNGKSGRYKNNLLRDLKAIADAAEIKKLTIHDLRRNYASHQVMHGVSHFQVMKAMGHHDAQTLMLYAHLSPGTNRFRNPSIFAEPDIWELLKAPADRPNDRLSVKEVTAKGRA